MKNKVDFLICRPIVGIPLFFLVMYAVFSVSFSDFGAWLTGITETFLFYIAEILSGVLLRMGTAKILVSFLVGICRDMASVLAFLPQTAIFFFLLKGLDDCGYLSRAVFVMDTVFSRFGLSGNAVIPAIVGCGCSVSAVSASESLYPKERKILLDSVPFLICNARFPVLFFFSEAFFPKHSSLAALFFYALSVLVFFFSALISSKGKNAPPLIVRLPDYKIPSLTALFREAKIKSREYLSRMATVVFLCAVSFRLFSLLTAHFSFTESVTESLLVFFGKQTAFFFRPLGFAEAPFAAALFAGFFAKENLMFILEILSPKEFSVLLSFPSRVSFTAFAMLYLPCFPMTSAVFRQYGGQKTICFLIRSLLFAYGIAFILYTLSDILVVIVKN